MDHSHHNSYRLSFELGERIWRIVKRWDSFTRGTIGNQLMRAADSISANIVEGWNRYYKKDKILFLLYARSSVFETAEWIRKAYTRGLLIKQEYSIIQRLILSIPKEINGLIKGIKQNLKI